MPPKSNKKGRKSKSRGSAADRTGINPREQEEGRDDLREASETRSPARRGAGSTGGASGGQGTAPGTPVIGNVAGGLGNQLNSNVDPAMVPDLRDEDLLPFGEEGFLGVAQQWRRT